MSHKPFVIDKAPGHRPARIAERIREELVDLLDSLKDPRLRSIGFITVTHVTMAPDLKNGTVQFTLSDADAPKAKAVEAALNQSSGYLRHELMQRLGTKITPQLFFKFDKGQSNAQRIEDLLNDIKK